MSESDIKIKSAVTGSKLNTVLLSVVLGVMAYLAKLGVDNHSIITKLETQMYEVNKQLDSKSFVTHPELDLAIANVRLEITRIELQTHELTFRLQRISKY